MGKQSIKKHNDGNLECEVAVMILDDDDGTYVAYCPALQLTTYGDSREDVEKAFAERLDIFIEEMEEKNLLHDELLRLGWNYEAGTTPHFRQPETINVPTYLLNKSKQVIKKQFAFAGE